MLKTAFSENYEDWVDPSGGFARTPSDSHIQSGTVNAAQKT